MFSNENASLLQWETAANSKCWLLIDDIFALLLNEAELLLVVQGRRHAGAKGASCPP